MAKQVSQKGLDWFQDSRFGMFIHWGLYALLGKHEWIMHTDRIPVEEYRLLAKQFNPVKFNADEWISIAADAGQKYVVITSRHHDGFSMYDTALSDYKVTNMPFDRDPIDELATAIAHRGDMKLGFYVSLLDWQHPAYRFRHESGLAWSDYLDFLHGQVRELCTQYGDLACIWFDGDWPNFTLDQNSAHFAPGGSFEYEKLYDMIHTLQPDAVVINNRHDKPLPGEDTQNFERDLPGMNTIGFNTTSVYDLPLEVGMTMNDHWGYSREDHNDKSTRCLIHLLARSTSLGANLLLNVGPTPEGEIPPLHALRLRQIGAWLKLNGASIYHTRAGAIPITESTVSTRRNGRYYVHVLDYVSDCVILNGVPDGVSHARLLRDNTPLTVRREWDDVLVDLPPKVLIAVPPEAYDPYDTVIELW
jgi:alpha-L-fucosidase